MRAAALAALLSALSAASPAAAAAQAAPAASPLAAGTLTEVVAQLEAFARSEMARENVPGLAFALVQGDRVVHARGYGVKRAGGTDPVTAQTVFEVGSTTKAFTSALVGMLVDEGRVRWSDRVVDHLPWFRMYDPWVGREFRVDDLMSARSGMPPCSLDPMAHFGFSRADISRAVAFVEPVTSARSEYAYVNTLWLSAAELVEKHGGLSWEDAMARRILGPLGMTSSTVDPEVVPLLDDVATGHFTLPDGTLWPVPADYPDRWLDAYGPAGSLRSNVLDMTRWIRMHLAGGTFEGTKLLAPETVAALHAGRTPVFSSGARTMSYGLGWGYDSRRAGPVVWHNGDTERMRTVVALYPSVNVGLVVLTNTDDNHVPEAMEEALYGLLFPAEAALSREEAGPSFSPEPPRPAARGAHAAAPLAPAPPLPLSRYTGSYTNPAYGTVTVAERSGALVLTIGPRAVEMPAVHYAGSSFRLTREGDPLWSTTATFAVPAGGPATRLLIEALSDVKGGWFERRPSYGAALEEARAAAREALATGEVSSLAIAMTDADGLVLAEGFGPADREKGVPATGRTMFGIASVSKMFAAAAVMQLVDRGLVDLDAPFARYVPELRMLSPAYRDVTVRMLLDHSSGLPGNDARNAITTVPYPGYLAQVVRTQAWQRLKAPPGFMSVYCNDGFTLLQALVKAVSGKEYARYLADEVLAPLGLADTRFPADPFADGSYARTYAGGSVQPREVTNVLGSGALYASVTDLAAFLRLFLNGGQGILSPRAVEEMAVDRTVGTFNPVKSWELAYGLGWDSVAQPGLRAAGVPAWAKDGDSTAYHSIVIVAPSEGLAVAVLFASGGAPTGVAERVLLRALAENGRIPAFPAPLPARAAPAAPVPDGLLGAIAGEYAAYDGLYRVRPATDGTLRIDAFQDGWKPFAADLRYREDGWFTSDAAPLVSYRLVDGDGTPYLARRRARGSGHYLDPRLFAQRVRGLERPLSAAWSRRLSPTWLLANEGPESVTWNGGPGLLARLQTVPELPGLLALGGSVVDPSRSDSRAESTLVIPGSAGRDLTDVEALAPPGGEERLRVGSFVFRQLETIPVVPKGATATVAADEEGSGDWRAVAAGASPVTVTLSGARAYRLYDASFALVASGRGDGTATLPPGQGLGRLFVHGSPGGTVTVHVE